MARIHQRWEANSAPSDIDEDERHSVTIAGGNTESDATDWDIWPIRAKEGQWSCMGVRVLLSGPVHIMHINSAAPQIAERFATNGQEHGAMSQNTETEGGPSLIDRNNIPNATRDEWGVLAMGRETTLNQSERSG